MSFVKRFLQRTFLLSIVLFLKYKTINKLHNYINKERQT